MSVEELLGTPPSEMLPGDSPPRFCFVVVMPPIQTEHLSETARIEILPEVPVKDSPPSKAPPTIKPLKSSKLPKAKDTPKPYYPRRLFTDNWNSFWHIAFGLFATKFKMLVPIFIFYQFLDMAEINVFVDIIEFLCGYLLGVVFSLI